jgi:hypothetical protein
MITVFRIPPSCTVRAIYTSSHSTNKVSNCIFFSNNLFIIKEIKMTGKNRFLNACWKEAAETKPSDRTGAAERLFPVQAVSFHDVSCVCCCAKRPALALLCPRCGAGALAMSSPGAASQPNLFNCNCKCNCITIDAQALPAHGVIDSMNSIDRIDDVNVVNVLSVLCAKLVPFLPGTCKAHCHLRLVSFFRN